MKGKITIVLLGLALVFGMIAASCDNGAYPALDNKDESTYFAYDGTGNTLGIPKFDGGKPVIITKGDLYAKTAEYGPAPIPGGDQNNRVKKYILTKVTAPGPGDEGTSVTGAPAGIDTVAKVKSTYAGMPLLIENPEWTSSSYHPVP